MNKIENMLKELQSGRVIFIYFVIVSIIISLIFYLKYSLSKNRFSSEVKHNSIKDSYDFEKYRPASCMLFILSLVEVIELPYTLLWAYSLSNGRLEHPVL